MKRLMALVLIFPLVFLALCPAHAEEISAEAGEMTAFFTRIFDRAEPVGGVALVAQGNEVLFSLPCGRGGQNRPVTQDTVFKVASVTKLITALGLMKLAEEGKINLDAPLSDSLGVPVLNPYHPDHPVTLRQVMSHTSSIAGSAPYTQAPRWENIAKESGYFNRTQPGSAYEYANLNGGILGVLIEQLSGQSLNDYMSEHIFAPLGLNAAYAATLLPDSSALSNTYKTNHEVYMSASNYLKSDESYDNTCNPAAHYRTSVGSLYISASSLCKIGMMLANAGELDGVRFLNAATVYEMQADQRLLPDSSVTGESPYGLNLYRHAAADGTVWYGHQGRWEGMTADLFYEPGSKTVLVLILNGAGTGGEHEVSRYARNALDFLSERLPPIIDE